MSIKNQKPNTILQIKTAIKAIEFEEKELRLKRKALEDKLLTKVIKQGCSHINKTTYTWEHDNGYGRQSEVEGHKCLDCGATNSWGSASNNWYRGDTLVR